jgi:hypothetical protein
MTPSLRSQHIKKTKMKKSTKSKTPAAPQVKKSATSTKKQAVGTKQAVQKAAAAPAKKKPAAKKAAAPVKAVPARKQAAVKTPAVKKTAVKKTVATKVVIEKSAPVPTPAAVKTTAVKKAAPKQAAKKTISKTVITAKINVGFGNTLFLRGEGPDLSWDVGAPMNCAGDDEWTFAIAGAKAPVAAKFLVNDITWSTGEDFVVEAGASVELEPSF